MSDEATRILTSLADGDRSVAARLMPLVYEELRDIASHYFRRQGGDHTLQPTALVHEAYLRLINQQGVRWKDRAHFIAVAATAMRQILINHAQERKTLKRGGDRRRVGLLDDVSIDVEDAELLALDEVMVKLSQLDERKSRVVELRFFGGLKHDEIAEVLGVSRTTVEGDWRTARAWLSHEMRADG